MKEDIDEILNIEDPLENNTDDENKAEKPKKAKKTKRIIVWRKPGEKDQGRACAINIDDVGDLRTTK